jgi:hypothetical protein
MTLQTVNSQIILHNLQVAYYIFNIILLTLTLRVVFLTTTKQTLELFYFLYINQLIHILHTVHSQITLRNLTVESYLLSHTQLI